jgi:hypothetical protein
MGFAILLCGVAAACSNAPTAARGDRQPGVIGIYRDQPTTGVLQLPATIHAGESFQAVVTTFGSSSCTQADGAEVSQSFSSAEITPYDLEAPAGTACTDDLHAFPRTVELRFATSGRGLIRVRGRSLYGGEAVVEQQVTVQ